MHAAESQHDSETSQTANIHEMSQRLFRIEVRPSRICFWVIVGRNLL